MTKPNSFAHMMIGRMHQHWPELPPEPEANHKCLVFIQGHTWDMRINLDGTSEVKGDFNPAEFLHLLSTAFIKSTEATDDPRL